MIKISLSLGILLLISIILFSSCSSFGTRPNDEDKKRFKDSKQFDPNTGKFDNRIRGMYERMFKKNMTWGNITEFFKGVDNQTPENKMPEVKPNIADFLNNSEELKVIWFGHSSFMLNMNGKIVLVDPVFSSSASPVSFLVKRFQKPVLQLDELPEIDYILISHDHYDHLDMDSIEYFKDKKAKFITPLGVGSHLKGWGIPENRITEKDWWESEVFDAIEFIATPAQHFSGRDGFHACETLWASWVIKSKDHNIFFSGDSGYDTHFKAIGDKYGPFDAAFIESGQYNKKWQEVHMLPEEGIQAYKDLRAEKYFPVHWGMFVLAKHTWSDPVEQLYKLGSKQNISFVTPKIRQIVNLKSDIQYERWWESVVSNEEFSKAFKVKVVKN